MKKVDDGDEGEVELEFEEDCCEEEKCGKEPSELGLGLVFAVFVLLSFWNEELDLECIVISEFKDVAILGLCCLADTSPDSFLLDTFDEDDEAGTVDFVVGVAVPLLVLPLLLPLPPLLLLP